MIQYTPTADADVRGFFSPRQSSTSSRHLAQFHWDLTVGHSCLVCPDRTTRNGTISAIRNGVREACPGLPTTSRYHICRHGPFHRIYNGIPHQIQAGPAITQYRLAALIGPLNYRRAHIVTRQNMGLLQADKTRPRDKPRFRLSKFSLL